MINHKESKEVRIDSWSLKLLSRDMKSKKTPITNQQTIIKEIQKNKGIGKYNTYRRSLSKKWIDGR